LGFEMSGDMNSCHKHDPEEGFYFHASVLHSVGSPHVAVCPTLPKSGGL
jgi:hypothetical protein